MSPKQKRSDHPGMTDASDSELMALLERIFADGIVEVEERAALERVGHERSESRAIFQRFLAKKWGEVLADGVITSQERLLLHRIVEALGLEREDLPEQLRLAWRS